MSDQNPPADNPFKDQPVGGGQVPGAGHAPGVRVMEGSNYVRQISLVAILLVLHGLLLCGAGIASSAIGITALYAPQLAEMQESGNVEEGDEDVASDGSDVEGESSGEAADETGESAPAFEPPPEAMMKMVSWIYGLAGGSLFLVGIIQLVAGVRNFFLRSRVFGLVALGLGVLAAFSVICAPTSLGLAIFGMVVYLSPAVTHAFQLRKDGVSRDEIMARFPRG